MIERRLGHTIATRLDEVPAVALLGPRQAGKTTLALQIADAVPSHYLDLQLPEDCAKLSNPAAYLTEHRDRLVILDEIHRVPELFGVLRATIDRNRRAGRRNGQFLILGSASPALLRQSGESLAGRLSYTELHGIDLVEALRDAGGGQRAQTLGRLWLRGGFPDSLLATSDESGRRWQRDFVTTYLQRDVPELGPAIATDTLRRFWTMLAHVSGGLVNRADLARSLDVNATTISRYLDLMCDLLLVRQLQPWHGNLGKRLVKRPKVYLRDSGVLHGLLGIADREALLGHPRLGDSFEGFIIEQLCACCTDEVQRSFFRTAAGAEIDLVLEFGSERWAIEIKHSSAPSPSRGFFEAARDIEATRRVLLYPGEPAYQERNGVEVMPVEALMQDLLARA